MAREYESTDIFQPTSFPEYTYVNRKIDGRETYESRLRKALKTKGLLTLITGSSKSGKTVLCHSVIQKENLIDISGSHIRTTEDFWKQISEKLQIPLETETTIQSNNEFGISGEVGGKTGIPIILEGTAKGGVNVKQGQTEATKEKYQRTTKQLIEYLIAEDKILVLDDFHYIEPELQMYIARILKSEIFYGLKAVIVSLPHRSDDAIRLNPDLSGRIRFIHIEPWSAEELREIPKKGFELLGVQIPDDLLDLLVTESITSPQLMQQNCLNLAYVTNIDEEPCINLINDIDSVYAAFVETTVDHQTYENVIRKLIVGPPQGREKRTQYPIKNDQSLDIYHVILYALAQDPPKISIDMDDLKRRITQVLENGTELPNNLTISNTLSQIQKILCESGSIYEILEWREQQLYILDPFFLFYLRWRNK